MRIIYGLVFFVLYLAWIIYHALIKRDLRRHLNDLYALTFFISIWALIYTWIFL